MVSSTLKIVIPMAGYGTRLRPITWSRPKQLIRMADKLVIDHLLDTFSTIPNAFNIEYVFIIGYLGDQIETYMRLSHPELQVTYVQQPEMLGQSHAIWLAREYLDGPLMVVYADTLIDTNFSFLSTEIAGGVTCVTPVPDPRRFGVAEVGKDGWVTHLVEKPQELDNNLALVGCYYFQSSADLLRAIDEQMQGNVSLKGEFFLADAVNIMLQHGLKMRTEHVTTWLDAGTPQDVLSTSRYLLDHGHANSDHVQTQPQAVILPPVYIHPTARVEYSILGPHVAVGANCKVDHSIIRDSIIEDSTEVSNAVLEHSLIGKDARIHHSAASLTLGDQSVLNL